MKDKNKSPLMWLFRIIQGIILGGAAILPGISAGVMCVSFGIYRPMMELLASPFKSFPKYWKVFLPIIIGYPLGFVVFAKLIEIFLGISEPVTVAAFVGLIAGTIPSLYREAGEKGRSRGSYISFFASFAVMFAFLFFIGRVGEAGEPVIPLGFGAFLLAGVLWGLSLIVPGLSSSPTLMALGIFEAMNSGMSNLDFKVLIPWGIGFAVTVIALSKACKALFEKFYNVSYHAILGITVASLIIIIPTKFSGPLEIILSIVFALLGFFAAFFMEKLKSKIE